MPKKKTGQRKKAEKQKLRQKEIRSKIIPLADVPCNATMEVYCPLKSFLGFSQMFFSRLIYCICLVFFFSATNASENKSLVPFAISVRACNVCRFVRNAAK